MRLPGGQSFQAILQVGHHDPCISVPQMKHLNDEASVSAPFPPGSVVRGRGGGAWAIAEAAGSGADEGLVRAGEVGGLDVAPLVAGGGDDGVAGDGDFFAGAGPDFGAGVASGSLRFRRNSEVIVRSWGRVFKGRVSSGGLPRPVAHQAIAS